MNPPQISHNTGSHEFYCIIDGQKCVVEYSVHPGALEFIHTYVPEALRGKGIAKMMYDEIARYLKEHHLKAIPTCSYAEKYFSDYKEQ